MPKIPKAKLQRMLFPLHIDVESKPIVKGHVGKIFPWWMFKARKKAMSCFITTLNQALEEVPEVINEKVTIHVKGDIVCTATEVISKTIEDGAALIIDGGD